MPAASRGSSKRSIAAAIEDMQAFLKAAPEKPEKSEAQYILAVCQAADWQAGRGRGDACDRCCKTIRNTPARTRRLYELAWSLDSQDKKPAAAEVFTRLAHDHAESPFAAEASYYVGELAISRSTLRRGGQGVSRRDAKRGQDRAGRESDAQARLGLLSARGVRQRPKDVRLSAQPVPAKPAGRATPVS